MTAPIRLAIVRQKYNPHGGAERFVARALDALSSRGALDVTLLARQWQQGDSGWHNETVNPRYSGRLGRDRGFARAVQKRFRDFDLVQSHERIPGAAIFRAGDGVHAVWLEQLSRVQGLSARLIRFLSPYHSYVCQAETEMFRHPALQTVICNSKLVRDEIADRFAVSDDKLELIYNGVDTEVFHPDLVRHRTAMRDEWRVPQDAPLLAYVGSGFARKGVSTALEAIVPYPDLHLVIAGADKHAKRYQKLAETLGVAARVRFLGGVADVKPVYGAADALILPTLYDPFPNVCVEAFASGLPVFTSPMCGAAEWVVQGENGWTNDALDIDGYRSAVGVWLARRDEWPALRAAARKTAEPFTLARMAGELEALYARLLART
ncbi:glycosyltransferase family 4 protein [Jeongeupia naejangsanensis]|uniref:Glycosyltransferase family 4 protein n=1 Tax=Jeongeupia naejangsanensis TaxID=613195 RepID=A0ABS2BM61_9NEIS|nr:glycosyltransferase family 4 protein [Jeongeupia naejangsanensis]MBM3116530.1 glycosyltransferase family 4 protein [Jeongeupia naejangsanensis]